MLFVQLSDIHLKDTTNINHLFCKIGEAIVPYGHENESIVLLLTGDISFSGKKEEYDNAKVLLDEIIKKIQLQNGVEPHVIMVPGNHDCDFDIKDKAVRDTRDTIIDKVKKGDYSEIKDECYASCQKTQENYKTFEAKYMQYESEYLGGLLKKIKLAVNDKEIYFFCLNSSWMSQLHEEEGKLFFPVQRLDGTVLPVRGDLIISVLHHPFSWFNVKDRLELKNFLEKNSDIIITGHEHVESKEVRDNLKDKTTEYITGDVLFNGNGSPDSGFNLIEVDFDKQEQKITNYKWNKDIYIKGNETRWFPYRRNIRLSKESFKISECFMEFLLDVGAKYYHPIKESLFLPDIYVYPTVKDILKTRSPKEMNKTLSSETVLKEVIGKLIILVGAEKSGKTSLCKSLYNEFYKAGFLPIYINGYDIKSATMEDFDKNLHRSIERQYNFQAIEYVEQVKGEEKILVIDDFNKTTLNSKYKHRFLTNLRQKYPNIILTVDDLFPVVEILYKDKDSNPLMKNSKQYQILEFGHQLRHKLIEKWLLLGQEQSLDEPELTKKIDYAKKIVDTIIGKNFVPSRPIYLLIILQTIEAGRPHDLKESAYGHYYQFLITQSLSKLVKQHDEIDAFYSFLTELAYFLYTKKLKEINRESLQKFHAWFCKDEYKISNSFVTMINMDKLVEILKNSSIIYGYSETYEFRYKYIYYYFVAKYFAIHLSKDKIRDEVQRLLGMLYVEEYANIIIFLTHHSKEEFIIEGILKNAQQIFSEILPIKFENDIEAINKLIDDIPQMVLEERDVRENRERIMQIKDAIEEEEKEKNELKENNELPEAPPDNMDIFMKLNLCFKYIEIIGQLLKNYHGSLNAKSRYKLGVEAYNLGMRGLNFFIGGLENNIESVVKEITSSIESDKPLDDDKIEIISKKIVFSLCFFISTGFIKKVSASIGHEKLSETFNEILENNPTNSFNLIDMSIKLDFYNNFPFAELKELTKLFEQNGLQYVILQRLVINYLYMFPTNEKDKQKICSLLGISMVNQRVIDVKSQERK